MENQEWMRLFEQQEERWLLILGSDWGASSGVPSSTVRTRWSPSISDLVRYDMLRTQAKGTFESLAPHIDGKPPLGFVADTLQDQAAWLDARLEHLGPQTSAFCLADLVKGGVFESAISSAPDRLLQQALDRLRVPYQEQELDDASRDGSAFSILREWDDLIFQDTQDRRAREARFVRLQMEQQLQRSDGVLILGHHPYKCELMDALILMLSETPSKRVVWINEEAVFSQQIEGSREPDSPLRWFAEHHEAFYPVVTERLETCLELILDVRDIEPSAYEQLAPKPSSGVTALLDKTFDIRPMLVYVPGAAIFSGLFDRIPQISIRAAVSIIALVALILGILNYQTYQKFLEAERPIRQLVKRTKAQLKDGAGYQQLLRAESNLFQVTQAIKRFRYPAYGPSTLPFLPYYLKRRVGKIKGETLRMVRFQLVPRLYHSRVALQLKGHSQMRSMGYYDELLVREAKLGVVRAHKAAGKARLPRPLSTYYSRNRVVLFYKSAPFLKNVLRKEMLRETKKRRLAVSVVLKQSSQRGILELLHDEILRVIRARPAFRKAFDDQTVVSLLKRGRISIYFVHFDTGGSVANTISQIQAFLSSYPKCRVIIGVSRKATRKAVLGATKSFVHLSISDYPFNQAHAYLRKKTSYRYVQRVYDNTYLRWNWKDPLIRSLLIDTYYQVGVAPRSIGMIYERLLQTMLSQGAFNFALKFKLLGLLADASARSGRAIHKEQAIVLWAKAFDPKNEKEHIAKAARLLKEITRNGVIFYHPKDGVTFSDKRFMYVCLSKHLVQRPLAEKKHLVLRMPHEFMAFYAGMSPSMTPLVASWLKDYMAIDQLYREKGQHLDYANPFLYTLGYAALAIMNGRVAHRSIKQVESILIEQVANKLLPVQAEVSKIVINLPTPRMQEWVRESINQNAPHDHRVLGAIASVTNPIYATPVKQWLARVATSRDKVNRWTRRTRRLPAGKRRLHVYHKWAIGHALITLAQLGTPDTVKIVEEYARRIKDKRFHQDDWNYFRYYAAEALLRSNHFAALHRLYPAFEKNPRIWCFNADRRYYSLFQGLGKINDKKTAALLVRLLMKPESLTWAVGRYKNDAATALARIDDEIVYPLLKPVMTQAPAVGQPDFRVYAGLVFSYKRKMDAFKMIKPIALEQLKWKPKTKDRRGLEYHTIMMIKTLAGFRTPEALAVLKTLYLNPQWRKLTSAKMLDGLNFFRFPETERFMLHRIHCTDAPVKDKARIMKVFGQIKSSSLHTALNRTVQMLQEGPGPLFRKKLCGPKAPLKWRPKEQKALMVSAIQTLAMFGQNNDIARLASWARHPNLKIQIAAMKALGEYRSQQASDALTRAYKANPRLVWYYVQALYKQRLPYNADKLVEVLKTARNLKVKSYQLYYLRKVGNQRALRAVLPFQYSPQIQLKFNARWAFHYIAMQLRGKIDDLDGLKEMIKQIPAKRAPRPAVQKRRQPRRPR